jgi:hypothetical protein
MEVHLGAEDGGFRELHFPWVDRRGTDQSVDEPWFLDPTTDAQGIIYDDGGSMKPSVLAFEPDESGTGNGILRTWHNDGIGLTVYVFLIQSTTPTDDQSITPDQESRGRLYPRQFPFERLHRYRRRLSSW